MTSPNGCAFPPVSAVEMLQAPRELAMVRKFEYFIFYNAIKFHLIPFNRHENVSNAIFSRRQNKKICMYLPICCWLCAWVREGGNLVANEKFTERYCFASCEGWSHLRFQRCKSRVRGKSNLLAMGEGLSYRTYWRKGILIKNTTSIFIFLKNIPFVIDHLAAKV